MVAKTLYINKYFSLIMIYLSVVIPCYNAEKTISQTIQSLDDLLSESNIDYGFGVINDGTTGNSE